MQRYAENITFLADGSNILPVLLQAIHNARVSIAWQVMLFHPDTIGLEIGDALAQAAKRGVAVRIAFNHRQSTHGSVISPYVKATREYYQHGAEKLWSLWGESGVQYLDSQFNWTFPSIPTNDPFGWRSWLEDLRQHLHIPLNHYDHRKLLIIDQKTAFVGTGNVGENYLYHQPVQADIDMLEQARNSTTEQWNKWLDAMLQVQGSVVMALAIDFEKHWWRMGGTPEPIANIEDTGTTPITALFQTPAQQDNFRVLLQAFDNATKTIQIVCPYITNPYILGKLVQAAERGVKVQIIYPNKHNDEPMTVRILGKYLSLLQTAGVEVFACNCRMIHTKITLIDGQKLLLGSFNLNYRSAYYDFELSLMIDNFGETQTLINRYMQMSERMEYRESTVMLPLWLRLLQPFT